MRVLTIDGRVCDLAVEVEEVRGGVMSQQSSQVRQAENQRNKG